MNKNKDGNLVSEEEKSADVRNKEDYSKGGNLASGKNSPVDVCSSGYQSKGETLESALRKPANVQSKEGHSRGDTSASEEHKPKDFRNEDHIKDGNLVSEEEKSADVRNKDYSKGGNLASGKNSPVDVCSSGYQSKAGETLESALRKPANVQSKEGHSRGDNSASEEHKPEDVRKKDHIQGGNLVSEEDNSADVRNKEHHSKAQELVTIGSILESLGLYDYPNKLEKTDLDFKLLRELPEEKLEKTLTRIGFSLGNGLRIARRIQKSKYQCMLIKKND